MHYSIKTDDRHYNLTEFDFDRRITKLSLQLQRLHGRSLMASEQHVLTSLFDDLHWLLLISGHVIALDSEGETPVIPQEILRHSISQAASVSVPVTLKVLVSIHLPLLKKSLKPKPESALL